MRVLVTGGTGYLGSAVVRAFAAAGHEPLVMARRASRHRLPGAALDADVRDRDAVSRAVAGCDAVCHLAATVSIWRARPSEFDEVNVGGLRNVLEASAARDLKVVVTSSFLALPPAGEQSPLQANDYQRTKVLAEREADRAARRGGNVVRLYPGVIYGPGVSSEGNLVGRLVADHLAGRLPGIVGGDRVWSFAWVEDVASAYVAAAERASRGSAYALGGENLAQRCLFELVRARTGARVPRSIPVGVAKMAGLLEETRARLFGATPLLTRGAVEIFSHDWPLDSRDAERELVYRVRPLASGVDELLAGMDRDRMDR